MSEDAVHLPWTTPPNGTGETRCEWCHRAIYLPALPCSIRPVEGLLRMRTRSGQGERCQYELSTRQPDLLEEPLAPSGGTARLVSLGAGRGEIRHWTERSILD